MNGYVYLHVLWKPIKDLFRVMHQISTLCNLVTQFVQFYWSSDLSQLTKYDIYNIMKDTCTHFLSSKLCIDWNNSLIWCTETLIRSKFLILILHYECRFLIKWQSCLHFFFCMFCNNCCMCMIIWCFIVVKYSIIKSTSAESKHDVVWRHSGGCWDRGVVHGLPAGPAGEEDASSGTGEEDRYSEIRNRSIITCIWNIQYVWIPSCMFHLKGRCC